MRSKHEAHGGEDNQLATAMDPYSKVDYSLIAPEASMAMKKISGGDSPLRQGAGKSFWTLPISGRRWQRITMYSRKVIRCLGFSRRGVFIGKGATSEVDQGALTTGGRGPGAGRTPWWCGYPVALLLFGSLEASVNFQMFGFCFVQFREYFLCNFSETQKQQKTGNWHCGISLIG
jgi:hypothetical protein